MIDKIEFYKGLGEDLKEFSGEQIWDIGCDIIREGNDELKKISESLDRELEVRRDFIRNNSRYLH